MHVMESAPPAALGLHRSAAPLPYLEARRRGVALRPAAPPQHRHPHARHATPRDSRDGPPPPRPRPAAAADAMLVDRRCLWRLACSLHCVSGGPVTLTLEADDGGDDVDDEDDVEAKLDAV